jgi:hypothetical protein
MQMCCSQNNQYQIQQQDHNKPVINNPLTENDTVSNSGNLNEKDLVKLFGNAAVENEKNKQIKNDSIIIEIQK